MIGFYVNLLQANGVMNCKVRNYFSFYFINIHYTFIGLFQTELVDLTRIHKLLILFYDFYPTFLIVEKRRLRRTPCCLYVYIDTPPLNF
jgi:hypothetical protein